ncbi:MAG: flagellar M-ring protein FliF, partial [Roseovarius sp.]|nr:flagellar M-ring protein FliF [Roseovarius sp.]
AAPDPATEAPQAQGQTPPALTGEIDTGAAESAGMALISGAQGAASAAASDTRLPVADASGADPAERLRGLIGERREETVEILRSWLEGEEEPA